MLYCLVTGRLVLHPIGRNRPLLFFITSFFFRFLEMKNKFKMDFDFV